MEFWGIEIKPGKPLKVEPEADYLIHISQASLGESKKGKESVPLFVKVGDQKFVLGTLSTEKLPQISLDLVFDQEFEISHNWKNGSVFVLGYKAPNVMDGEIATDEDHSDFDDSEEEELPLAPIENGKPKANAVKPETKPKSKAEEQKKDVESDSEEDDESDEDDENDESDSEESDEMGMDEDSDDDETPKKVEPSKKRPNSSATKTPVPSKKAKAATPQKTDGKKGGHTDTPHPAKAGNKPSQSPKSGGQFSCGSCKKSFNSDVGLQSHNKAKHSAK